MATKLMLLSGCFAINSVGTVIFISFNSDHAIKNRQFKNFYPTHKTAIANFGYNKTIQYIDSNNITDQYTDNDHNLFGNGYTKEYYYNWRTKYSEANLNFTITSAGAVSLVQEYRHVPSSWKTGETIMDWLNHHLRHISAN